MVGRLQIEVLGELKVKCDGQILPLPHSRKTRALLAYLAVVGRPERREHLCRMFWGIPDDPRASLRWSLHKIRQVTNTKDHERLTADREAVLLKPQTIDLDFRKVTSCRVRDLDAIDADELVPLHSDYDSLALGSEAAGSG